MNPTAPLADYAAVQDYLFGLKAGGLKFGVDRMRLMKQLPVMDLLALIQFMLLPEDDLNLALVEEHCVVVDADHLSGDLGGSVCQRRCEFVYLLWFYKWFIALNVDDISVIAAQLIQCIHTPVCAAGVMGSRHYCFTAKSGYVVVDAGIVGSHYYVC